MPLRLCEMEAFGRPLLQIEAAMAKARACRLSTRQSLALSLQCCGQVCEGDCKNEGGHTNSARRRGRGNNASSPGLDYLIEGDLACTPDPLLHPRQSAKSFLA